MGGWGGGECRMYVWAVLLLVLGQCLSLRSRLRSRLIYLNGRIIIIRIKPHTHTHMQYWPARHTTSQPAHSHISGLYQITMPPLCPLCHGLKLLISSITIQPNCYFLQPIHSSFCWSCSKFQGIFLTLLFFHCFNWVKIVYFTVK